MVPYNVGDIIDFQDIAAGVENSNFFVTTTRGRYVLTIFEKIPRSDLDFYMGLMSHLHDKDIACASPLRTMSGIILQELKGKPAALVMRLQGGDIAHPKPVDCHAVGAALAKMHIAAADFSQPMANWRGLSWWRREAEGLKTLATPTESVLLQSEIAYQSSGATNFDHLDLPRGIVHADLFRDNTLWDDHADHHVPQMIDFYFACHDQLLWDVAITVNDWCLDFAAYPNAKLNDANTGALLAGYTSVRAFVPAERLHWGQMLRAAALRSWLGRLGYHYFPRASALTHSKDYSFSERLLRFHIENHERARILFPN
ncbi:MAG: homoserine kinase [Pseudomonadota bacterium]